MRKLKGKDRKLFDEFATAKMHSEDDLACAYAKLEGDWPGWEWMKEERKRRFK